jgi:hypothetical protein
MKKETNKFTYVWISCLLLMISVGFIGTNIAVKKTYSAGSNCYIYNGKTECLDLAENTVYGRYRFGEPDTSRIQDFEINVKFTYSGRPSLIFDKIKVDTKFYSGYTHLIFISGDEKHTVAKRLEGGGYNEDWHMEDGYSGLEIYVIEPTTLSDESFLVKSDFERFETYTYPFVAVFPRTAIPLTAIFLTKFWL